MQRQRQWQWQQCQKGRDTEEKQADMWLPGLRHYCSGPTSVVNFSLGNYCYNYYY